VPRRSLYRHLERAGFVSPRELLSGARLLRAYAFLRQPTYSLELVASHLRFTDAEAMTKAMKWGVGITPARARDRMGAEEFVARLAERLWPPGKRSEGPRELLFDASGSRDD
jgi:AraC-like DNA-binding protein